VPCSVTSETQYRPAALMAAPATRSGRAPMRETSVAAAAEATNIAAVIGRNATPVRSAE
jgi:hypothetical protein